MLHEIRLRRAIRIEDQDPRLARQTDGTVDCRSEARVRFLPEDLERSLRGQGLAISAEPSLDALSISTTRSGAGSSFSIAERHAGRVSA
jgi:hypothetical protein